MPGGTHLELEEREQPAALKAEGLSLRAIAARLGRAASTVSRELRRNALPKGGYLPAHAEGCYRERRQAWRWAPTRPPRVAPPPCGRSTAPRTRRPRPPSRRPSARPRRRRPASAWVSSRGRSSGGAGGFRCLGLGGQRRLDGRLHRSDLGVGELGEARPPSLGQAAAIL